MNPASTTNWIPGLLMLGVGALAALAFIFTNRKKASPASTGLKDDLDARYQSKLAELKDLRTQQRLLPPQEFQATRKRLEAEAAAVLRERDGAKHEAVKAAARAEKRAQAQVQASAPDASFWSRNPQLSGGLIGGAVVGFFLLLGFNLTQSTTDKVERGGGMMPGGGGARGPMQDQQGGGPEQEDPRLTALAQRVQASPEDPDAVAELALFLVRRQAFDDAKPLVERVTMLDPFQVKGRVGRAVLRAVEGDAKGSQADLEHLAASYPEAYDARMFAGLIAMEGNENERALKNLRAYLATAPVGEQPPMMRMLVQQLEGKTAGGK
jgi:F0F1-type ATP synthase assembly protein I